ncbi:unnamed protein product [Colias eurytheme]|nr:unnamed protein product [Colias eurytheme]
MRLLTIVALVLSVAIVISMRCCAGASVRGLQVREDEDELRPRRVYRNYGLRNQYDAFDDYGHLRFGRSED